MESISVHCWAFGQNQSQNNTVEVPQRIMTPKLIIINVKDHFDRKYLLEDIKI